MNLRDEILFRRDLDADNRIRYNQNLASSSFRMGMVHDRVSLISVGLMNDLRIIKDKISMK